MTNTTNKMEENTMANEMEYALIDTADGEIMFCGTLADCESEKAEYDIETLEIVNKAEHRAQLENRQDEIREEIKQYFCDNDDEFAEMIESLDDWNGYLGDERYYDMYMLSEMFTDIEDYAQRSYFGNDLDDWHTDDYTGRKCYNSFNPNREYFRFNGLGNLDSSDWKDYSDHLDDYAIDEIIENAGHLDLPCTVDELIEELENIEYTLNELD